MKNEFEKTVAFPSIYHAFAEFQSIFKGGSNQLKIQDNGITL